MAKIADLLVDRMLQRPRGFVARRMWRDMKAHHGIFHDTLAELELTADDNLLEIGCGGGTFVRLALESSCRATAVDHSTDMAELARRNNADAVAAGRLAVVVAPAESLPFADGTFTHAALMNVLFFVDVPATLGELRRVLAPGARLVIHTVAPNPPASIMPPPVARRLRLWPDDELLQLMENADFADVKVRHTGKGFQLVTATRPVAKP